MPEHGSRALMELDGVTKVFLAGDVETHALTGVYLRIFRGDFVSICGPSGCGKSTLLSILGLLEAPTDGAYFLDGEPVDELTAPVRARLRNRDVGFVFQSGKLVADLSIFENIELPMTYCGLGPRERRRRVVVALDRVGLTHCARHLPNQLSGGQQQRAAVARAIAAEPRILLADEPTGSLDAESSEDVMNLLRELRAGGSTICMVTHDRRRARSADRIVELFDGRVVEDRPALVQEQSSLALAG